VLTSRLRLFGSTLIVMAGLFAAAHVHAQTAAGSLLENGEIVVKIYVTMNQVGMPSGRPISDFTIAVVAPSGERSTVTTNDAGAAAMRLRPGEYRVVSLKPLEWYGHHYRWDLPLEVREGMHVLDLTPNNAVREMNGDRERPAAPPSETPAPATASTTTASTVTASIATGQLQRRHERQRGPLESLG
jgi:hypothetical protein